MIEKYSMGTDPELMLAQNGTVISAIPLIEKNKFDPVDFGGGYRGYHDNVNAEFQVKPANSPDEFVSNIKTLFSKVREKYPQIQLRAQASHTFTKDECQHPDAKEFGCDSEYDVWRKKECKPSTKGVGTFRSAGGHIHLGNNTFQGERSGYLLEFADKEQAIKLMDLFVGLPLTIVDNDPSGLARKKLYGKAGRFRITEYGVEYRTPSPFWLSRPALTKLVADLTYLVMEIGDKNEGEKYLKKVGCRKVVRAINKADKELARELINKIGLPDNLMNQINQLAGEQANLNVFETWEA